MKLIVLAAVSTDGTIGDQGRIPWHIREDLQRFKRLTMGHAVIMGRKTFESIGKPLPGRRNLVLSRRERFPVPEGVSVFPGLAQAIAHCEAHAETVAFVIGGAEVYREALPRADRLCLTEVHRSIPGDTRFPEFDRAQWVETAREDHGEYSFVELVRVT